MAKLQEVESRLAAVNDAVFQNLCDTYIYHTEPGYPEIHRSGSQKGKQKTTKGRPDSYFQTSDGKYVLIEYSTQCKSLLKKIKDDLTSCLNPKITGIPLQNIEKIIYCCNSSIDIKEHKELTDKCLQKGVYLELKTLDSLSTSLSGRCAFIAKEYLDVSIDTGQVLTIDNFTVEYESSGYATTLTTEFISRETEFARLENSIYENKISIVSGPPGVGKTRLVLALMEKLSKDLDKKIVSYCLSNKNAPIYDDLRTFLQDGQDFLIFIDDANRQSGNLASILPFLAEKRDNPIRLVITVRDYALDEVKRHCIAHNPQVILIPKMTDDDLTKILKSETFKIINQDYINRILDIAGGNPRLAVMAAKVAVEKNELSALADVSELYDRYFSHALSQKVMEDIVLMKTLGIVSFFQYINHLDQDFCATLCANFEIDPYLFRESCQELEKLELLESSEDYSIVKIPEQTLGTYFFYRTYFREPILNFSVILNTYFDSHFSRIQDTVVPANNTFGFDNVYKKVDPFISEYWKTISKDEAKVFKFMDIFWYYRLEETLAFVHDKIEQNPIVENPFFYFDEKKANASFYNNDDKYLSLLSKLFPYVTDSLEDAIDLSFAYVRRHPESYTQLIRFFKGMFIFRPEDENHAFYRQMVLSDYLVKQDHMQDILVTLVFFDIMPDLMKTQYNSSSMNRSRDSMTIYRYTITLSAPIRQFRENCWVYLFRQFKVEQERTEQFIQFYLERNVEKEKTVYEFDLPFLVKIFEEHFSDSLFTQCYLVQYYISSCLRIGIEADIFPSLKEKFNSRSYIVYNRLTFDRLRDREEFNHSYNHQEYQQLKEQEIRDFFRFNSLVNFKEFSLFYNELSVWAEKRQLNFYYSLDIILEDSLIKDLQKGLDFVKYLISSGNPSGFRPWRVFQVLSKEVNFILFQQIYELMLNSEFKAKEFWVLNCLYFINEENIANSHAVTFIDLFKDIEIHFYADANNWEKFLNVEPDFYKKMLEQIYSTNKNKKGPINFDATLLKEKIEFLKFEMDLVKRTYLQQRTLKPYFDHDYGVFLEIMKRDSSFLTEYLDFWMDQIPGPNDHDGISIVWDLNDASKIIRNAFNQLTAYDKYYVSKNFFYSFFKNSDQKAADKGFSFLKEYVTEYKTDPKKVNAVIDCIQQFYAKKMEEILLHFLALNPDISIFTKIQWAKSRYIGNGNTSFGEIKMTEYDSILTILDKIPKKKYKYAKHKEFIKGCLADAKKWANRERKDRFISQDW